MSRVVVVGGGVGGLGTAIRLAATGHQVTVLERHHDVGGKLSAYERDGYTFDLGPSLITLPHVLDDTFRAAGTTLAEHVDLVRLDPQFRYRWSDGAELVVRDDPAATEAAFESFTPGGGDRWREFDAKGRQIWEIAERTFFAGPMEGMATLLDRMESPSDLTAIDGMRTLWSASRRTFGEGHLEQWVGRYATYSGSSPLQAPATLACIPHVESAYGCWYTMGGLGALRDAFERVARHAGVELVTGADVARITSTPARVTGVELADGSFVDAPIVVANVDAHHLYGDLLPDDHALRKVRKAGRSSSGLALCLGVRGRTPDLAHHNVWFSDDMLQEFRQLDAGQLADDPTIYACVSSVTDPSQAPEGNENWYLLVNTPAGVEVDSESYRDLVLARLATHGVELRDRMRFCARLTPQDIERLWRSPGGAIYGSSSNGWRAAFLRPTNRGIREGLYLVGGSSHPGGGLPLVSMSGRIVADMIAADLAVAAR